MKNLLFRAFIVSFLLFFSTENYLLGQNEQLTTFTEPQKLFVSSFLRDIQTELNALKKNKRLSQDEKMKLFQCILSDGNQRVKSSRCPENFRKVWLDYSSTVIPAMYISVRMMQGFSVSTEDRKTLKKADEASNIIWEIAQKVKNAK